MNGRFFLDTNIFVYTFDEASSKAAKALELVRRALETRKGVVSYQIVQEFFNVAFRKFSKPMTSADAAQYLTAVFQPLWTIHSSTSLFREALRLQADHRLSWYDSLVIAAAMESECNILYSEDLQHDRRFASTRIENPFRQ
jgi:predicted nucleic acid-binding protein